MIDTTRTTLMRQFIQRFWNEGDFASLTSLVAREYSVSPDDYDPWSGQVIGHETFIERVLYSRNAFPDLNFYVHEMAEGTDSVAIRWTMSGTHIGDLPILPATGRKFSIPGMTFYYVRDGKFCGHTQSFDQFGFLKQMGVF